MFHFLTDERKRKQWLEALNIADGDITEHSRTCICSRHFLDGNPSNPPSLDLGKCFASLKKVSTERGMRAIKRASWSPSLSATATKVKHYSATPSSSRTSSVSAPTPGSATDEEPMSVSIGEPLMSDYSIHELPLQDFDQQSECSTALAARGELLEAETRCLRSQVGKEAGPPHFRIEQIVDNDSLIKFYTGFASYSLLLNFLEFRGPAVYQLNYWGAQKRKTNRRRKTMALSAPNQLFLTLVKLKLNLNLCVRPCFKIWCV